MEWSCGVIWKIKHTNSIQKTLLIVYTHSVSSWCFNQSDWFAIAASNLASSTPRGMNNVWSKQNKVAGVNSHFEMSIKSTNNNNILLFKHDGFQSSKFVGSCVQIKLNQMQVFWGEGKTRVPGEKTSQSREENQQTQPTCDAESGEWTQATLVGGKCSHHCSPRELLMVFFFKCWDWV